MHSAMSEADSSIIDNLCSGRIFGLQQDSCELGIGHYVHFWSGNYECYWQV